MAPSLRVALLLLAAASLAASAPQPGADKADKADADAKSDVLEAAAAAAAAETDAPAPTDDPVPSVVGSKKFATAVDCSGAVAFSSVGAAPSSAKKGAQKLRYSAALTDKGVGWSRDSGEFTTFCPGLYQFAFSGGGIDARLALKKKASGEGTTWEAVVPSAAAASAVLLDMDVGDQVAVFLQEGELTPDIAPSTTFSGFRIARK